MKSAPLFRIVSEGRGVLRAPDANAGGGEEAFAAAGEMSIQRRPGL